MLNPIWEDRIKEILEDEEKARIAALLYYLVQSSVNSKVTRKRTTKEELLWNEANNILGV